jgi:ribonuclease III
MNNELEENILYVLNENNIYITKEYIQNILTNMGIKHEVNQLELYQIAMTHVSYITSHQSKHKKINKHINIPIDPINDEKMAIPLQEKSYERSEFVGDSVIRLILATYLWTRFENQNEGFMTKLRTKMENGLVLSKLAKSIGLHKYILISRALEKTGCREKNTHMLEDIFEAFIMALFIDSNKDYKMCEKFVITLIEKEIDIAELLHSEDNFKDILLQYFHKQKWQDPVYDVLNISGPDYKKEFSIYVKRKVHAKDEGDIVGTGTATSKKKGEQYAAKQALIYFGIMKDTEYDSESYESYSDETDDDISIIDDDSVDDKNYNFLKINNDE